MTKVKETKVEEAVARFIAEKPKATLKSLKLIVSEFNGLPTKVIDEEGNIDFDTVGTLITIGVQQIDNSVTTDEVENAINMDNLQEALQAATNFIMMTIPAGVIPPEMGADTEDDDSKN